jgi:hypothetical protein
VLGKGVQGLVSRPPCQRPAQRLAFGHIPCFTLFFQNDLGGPFTRDNARMLSRNVKSRRSSVAIYFTARILKLTRRWGGYGSRKVRNRFHRLLLNGSDSGSSLLQAQVLFCTRQSRVRLVTTYELFVVRSLGLLTEASAASAPPC